MTTSCRNDGRNLTPIRSSRFRVCPRTGRDGRGIRSEPDAGYDRSEPRPEIQPADPEAGLGHDYDGPELRSGTPENEALYAEYQAWADPETGRRAGTAARARTGGRVMEIAWEAGRRVHGKRRDDALARPGTP